MYLFDIKSARRPGTSSGQSLNVERRASVSLGTQKLDASPYFNSSRASGKFVLDVGHGKQSTEGQRNLPILMGQNNASSQCFYHLSTIPPIPRPLLQSSPSCTRRRPSNIDRYDESTYTETQIRSTRLSHSLCLLDHTLVLCTCVAHIATHNPSSTHRSTNVHSYTGFWWLLGDGEGHVRHPFMQHWTCKSTLPFSIERIDMMRGLQLRS
ncbi:hypothetical protein BC629DRAFT_12713 [Irpex lacteus]|nr:hypothetical protein BC629DRAFT_12713 [Irpex lacteus]